MDRLEDGGRARLWGRWHDVEHRREGRARAWIAGQRLIITGEDEAARERAIARFRRSEMERVSRPLLDSWGARHGGAATSRDPVSRHAHQVGFLQSPDQGDHPQHDLGEVSVAALEYVIVHELAHLRHADHGRGFWSLVADALPDHGERRKLLSTYTP
ncbi:YgjP-like metallopeptidase domain-containing protein [Arachnia propionica]|nr:YgjP-like metallopeptidase domain-containing protein [Arachnia propionica]